MFSKMNLWVPLSLPDNQHQVVAVDVGCDPA